jgi:hypothetical protein
MFDMFGFGGIQFRIRVPTPPDTFSNLGLPLLCGQCGKNAVHSQFVHAMRPMIIPAHAASATSSASTSSTTSTLLVLLGITSTSSTTSISGTTSTSGTTSASSRARPTYCASMHMDSGGLEVPSTGR